jgi:hypothetical protein
VSAPNEQARTAIPVSAGHLLADGRRVYRLTASLAVWWIWVALALVSLGDLVIQGHDFISVQFAFGLLTVTGLVFACTLWPRVVADDAGIIVRNPFRTFTIPWGAVRGIYLADSVEIQCARAAGKDKTVYCWALSSARRGRARARLQGWQWEQGKRNRPSSYGQLPGQAKELVKMTPTEVMAREMARMSEEARARSARATGDAGRGAGDPATGHPATGDLATGDLGAQGLGRVSVNGSGPAGAGENPAADGGPGGTAAATAVVTSMWSWGALAAILVPGIAFAIFVLAG